METGPTIGLTILRRKRGLFMPIIISMIPPSRSLAQTQTALGLVRVAGQRIPRRCAREREHGTEPTAPRHWLDPRSGTKDILITIDVRLAADALSIAHGLPDLKRVAGDYGHFLERVKAG